MINLIWFTDQSLFEQLRWLSFKSRVFGLVVDYLDSKEAKWCSDELQPSQISVISTLSALRVDSETFNWTLSHKYLFKLFYRLKELKERSDFPSCIEYIPLF